MIILLFGLFNLSFADDCSDMRLDKNGGPLEKIPIMDQGGTNLCYAYSAAQMIDAYRFSHGDNNYKHLTSPLGVAITYKSNDENSNDLDFGRHTGAINQTIRAGSCSLKSLPIEYRDLPIEEMLYMITTELENFENENAKDLYCDLKYYGIKIDSIKGLKEIANNKKFYLELFKKTCETRRIDIPRATMKAHQLPSISKRESVLTSLLLNRLNRTNPQPVGIMYCTNIRTNKKTFGISNSNIVDKEKCGDLHASIVIGKRINKKNGKCEFLVRDSFGTSCHPYDWPCENGQFWVEASALTRNIAQTHVIGKH